MLASTHTIPKISAPQRATLIKVIANRVKSVISLPTKASKTGITQPTIAPTIPATATAATDSVLLAIAARISAPIIAAKSLRLLPPLRDGLKPDEESLNLKSEEELAR